MSVMLVTGGSRGIGAAVCRMAAVEGWQVLVNYTSNRAAADQVVADVNAAGSQAVALQGDVANEADAAAMYDAAEAMGPVTAVVINAGIITQYGSVADMDVAKMRRLFDVNVLGAFLVAREAARRMPTNRGGPGGAVVITSSAASRLGSPHEFVDYAGSKGATDALTLGLAKELALRGIRVNTIAPGLFMTPMMAGMPDEVQESLAATLPFPKRLGKPEEFGMMVDQMVRNPILNGEVIRLDCALRMAPK